MKAFRTLQHLASGGTRARISWLSPPGVRLYSLLIVPNFIAKGWVIGQQYRGTITWEE